MALIERKITEYSTSVKSLPDRPAEAGISAAELKAVFDARTDNEIKSSINGIVEDLVSGTALYEISFEGKSVWQTIKDLDTKYSYRELGTLTLDCDTREVSFNIPELTDFTLLLETPPVANSNGVLYLSVKDNYIATLLGIVSQTEQRCTAVEAHNVGIWRVDAVSGTSFNSNASRGNVGKTIAMNYATEPKKTDRISVVLGSTGGNAYFPVGTKFTLYGRRG